MLATLAELPEDFRSGMTWMQKDGAVRASNADALLGGDRIEPWLLLLQGWQQGWQKAALRARHCSIAVQFVVQHKEASDLAALGARACRPSAPA
jgi:hypothetical protein